jgi:hypothetical protein
MVLGVRWELKILMLPCCSMLQCNPYNPRDRDSGAFILL